jgi:hypothetical protein
VYVLDGKRTGPGTVEIDVRPRKATVRLDGENVGRAKDYNGSWNVLVLEPGRYLLELERDGYRTLQIPLEVESAAHYHILERLEEGEGLDPRSATWEDVAAAEAEAGASGDAGAEGSLELETRRSPVLSRGFLRLEVTPRDAAVYLDGEFLASGDELSRLHGALAVAGGEHVVEVVRPGYETRRIEVLVEGDEPVVVRVALEES